MNSACDVYCGILVICDTVTIIVFLLHLQYIIVTVGSAMDTTTLNTCYQTSFITYYVLLYFIIIFGIILFTRDLTTQIIYSFVYISLTLNSCWRDISAGEEVLQNKTDFY
jgi:hypothetical protein